MAELKTLTTGTHAILYASLAAAITAAGADGTVFLPPGIVSLPAAGLAAVNDDTPMTFASLPAGGAGSQCTITDSSVVVAGMAAAGGGSTRALVWRNATAWQVVAV